MAVFFNLFTLTATAPIRNYKNGSTLTCLNKNKNLSHFRLLNTNFGLQILYLAAPLAPFHGIIVCSGTPVGNPWSIYELAIAMKKKLNLLLSLLRYRQTPKNVFLYHLTLI